MSKSCIYTRARKLSYIVALLMRTERAKWYENVYFAAFTAKPTPSTVLFRAKSRVVPYNLCLKKLCVERVE